MKFASHTEVLTLHGDALCLMLLCSHRCGCLSTNHQSAPRNIEPVLDIDLHALYITAVRTCGQSRTLTPLLHPADPADRAVFTTLSYIAAEETAILSGAAPLAFFIQ